MRGTHKRSEGDIQFYTQCNLKRKLESKYEQLGEYDVFKAESGPFQTP